MPTPTPLLEVLAQLRQEAQQTQLSPRSPLSEADYRQWQEMWNPNWSRAGEQEMFEPNAPP